MTMRQQIESATAGPRQLARLASGFGLAAVLLACVGLYGVVSYGLTQRVREFGVRLALGASQRDLVVLVVREVFLAVGIGSAAGLAIAISIAFGGHQFFAGVSPLDPLALAATIAVLTLVALAAVLPPTLRATRIAPFVALRESPDGS
jgi:ABC-type antimicrobial peptide transport system permease subunit